MDQGQKYNVMELADLIGVPRTTINDWLNRYSQYIEFQMQGRRRCYPESALAVLKTIAAMRAEGKTPYEIEVALASKYAIHAEPAGVHTEEHFPQTEEEIHGEESPEAAAPGNFALVGKKQSDELNHFITENFHAMAEKLGSLESNSRRNHLRMQMWLLLAVLLLAAACVAAVFAVMKMNSLEQNNTVMTRDAEEKNLMLQELQKQTIFLGGSAAEMQKNIAELESGLQSQQKVFDAAIREQKEAHENTLNAELDKKEAELALEREKFAKERLEFLRDRDRLSSDHEQIVLELQEKINELEKKSAPEEPQPPPPAEKKSGFDFAPQSGN